MLGNVLLSFRFLPKTKGPVRKTETILVILNKGHLIQGIVCTAAQTVDTEVTWR